MLSAYQKEQLALFHQEQALRAGGATSAQLQAWHQQNAALFTLQLQRAESMTTASALQLQPTNQQPNIPANASPVLKQFLARQSALANAHARIHNQLVQQAGQNPSYVQVCKMEQGQEDLFRQQNAALITLQVQQSQALTAASAQRLHIGSASLAIPANATPQMAAFLSTRYQIRQALIQINNQEATATPAERKAAMQNWYQQHASMFAQLHQQAQNLSQANASPTNPQN